jgi:hypothetical protein
MVARKASIASPTIETMKYGLVRMTPPTLEFLGVTVYLLKLLVKKLALDAPPSRRIE